MTDYKELIKALRCCGNVNTDCTVCPWDKYNFGMCAEKLYTDAAAAIEELSKTVKDLTTKIECSPMQISEKAFDRAIEAWNERARKEVRNGSVQLEHNDTTAVTVCDDVCGGGAGMSYLIDREAVREFIKSYSHSTDVVYHMEKHLYEVPTIDAVPVVHGEWIIDGAYIYYLENDGKAYEPVYRCSCCHRQTESYLRLDEPKMPEDADFPEFCPHCGARMDGKEQS